ncbi:hypothetical protein BIV57_05505 [Mangrovactinospora gilvigrisea]|uniref:PE-PGRS family protein n=1 Tax=Mangrovactinospora gilvigrisea TaxID=1428644 RepID=A0A1J7BIN3_9ACTN|nr:hypothetical protein BIV57_05505 [Mangrovactinospora gilvigrisea]
MFALVCVGLAAAGHSLSAPGAPPIPVAALAAAFAAVACTAAALAGRERSTVSIAAGLTVGQLALHMLFMAAQCGTSGAAATRSAADRIAAGLLCGGHAHGADAVRLVRQAGLDGMLRQQAAAHASGGMAGMAGAGHAVGTAVLGLTPAMIAGHALAALAAGWWLRRGEAALWLVVRLAARAAGGLRLALALASALLLGTPGPRPRRVRRPRRPHLPATLTLLRHTTTRRGPPVAYAPAV